jgi:pimeloyl-ACP methyl ester carboxylesterase
MALATCVATAPEKRRPLAVDGLVPDPIFSATHAITIDAPPEQVWPWIAQMGGGRAGWYSWDEIDNGGVPSSRRVVPEFQRLASGDIMPAVPGAADAFVVTSVDPPRDLILAVPDGQGGTAVAWEHVLDPLDGNRTRLIARSRASAHWLDLARATPPAGDRPIFIERAYSVLARLPRPLLIGVAALGHRIMEARHLRGIRRRASRRAFRTPEGEAMYFAAYDAVLKRWPVPFEEIDIPTRFGTTHVTASGPKDAPPLVLLHGYMATSMMWALNIGDFSQRHRVYAIDTMGQPGKSIPGDPIRSAAEYVAWLTATLDALHLDRVDLAGQSFGGWLALNYAIAAPERVRKLVLLSAGGILPISTQFKLRGLLMMLVPARFTVKSFWLWAGFRGAPDEIEHWRVMDLMYLGIKHFRMPPETTRIAASPASDDELRTMRMPVLFLMGKNEVLCDAAAALARARRLVPDFQGELIPHCRHDMCATRSRIVDALVLEFLAKGHPQSGVVGRTEVPCVSQSRS